MEIKTVSKKTKLLPGLDMPREEFMTHVRKAEEIQGYCKSRSFNPAIEGGELTIDELKAMVKEAEEGPFYTLKDGQEMKCRISLSAYKR